MTSKIISVPVTIVTNQEVAKAIAMAELEGVYSSSSAALKLDELKANGITLESLTAYFINCATLQAAFCEQKRDISSTALKDLGFKFSELKELYLPTLSSTILANLGDVTFGSYHIEVCKAAEAKVDRTFVIRMSEALYRCQHLLYAQKDQIGVANREVMSDMMASVVTTMSVESRSIRTATFVGTNPDSRAIAINALMGVTLKDAAMSVLYPFEDYVEYGRLSRLVSLSKPE